MRGVSQGNTRRNRSGTDAPCGRTEPRTTKVTRPACSPLPTHRATSAGCPARSTPFRARSPLPRKLTAGCGPAAPFPRASSVLIGSTVRTTSLCLAVRAAARNSMKPTSTRPSNPSELPDHRLTGSVQPRTGCQCQPQRAGRRDHGMQTPVEWQRDTPPIRGIVSHDCHRVLSRIESGSPVVQWNSSGCRRACRSSPSACAMQ